MKTEIITDQIKTEIDWDSAMVVKWRFGELYLLTTGSCNTDNFSAVVLKDTSKEKVPYNEFHYSNNWTKSEFTPITEPIIIKFIPE